MKKFLLVGALLLSFSIQGRSGDLISNTNQHAAYLRMLARGASIGIDGVYYNPAGLSFLQDGWYLSANNQFAFQTRNIQTTFPLFKAAYGTESMDFDASTTSLLVPSVMAAYVSGNWTFSGGVAVTGGGGKASFGNGVGSFNSMVMASLYSKGITPNLYSISSNLEGSQMTLGFQLGASYKITDIISVYAGVRMSYVNNGMNGFIAADMGTNRIVNMQIDCKQQGVGVSPIIAADAKFGSWNFAAKYEFCTKVTLENKTTTNTTGFATYDDGYETPYDLPAYLMVAGGYAFSPSLRANIEYHHFFDQNAKMAGDKQKDLKGVNEYLAGLEWDVLKRLTISCGFQYTDAGLADSYQSDTSYNCNSWSLGLGGAFAISQNLKLNLGYLYTNYIDYTKETAAGKPGFYNTTLSGKEVFSRTSNVVGIGIDWTIR